MGSSRQHRSAAFISHLAVQHPKNADHPGVLLAQYLGSVLPRLKSLVAYGNNHVDYWKFGTRFGAQLSVMEEIIESGYSSMNKQEVTVTTVVFRPVCDRV
jgi:hypothetical protein